jgi:xylulokinase
MAAGQDPLYLGFDLSTQQLKAVIVNSQLKVQHVAKFDFDADSKGFDIKKGVMVNEELHEVYAPVALWLQAVDVVLERLKDSGLDFSLVKAISGAGQQHGSVYWSAEGESALQNLDSSKTLESQLDHAFSHPFSPNWQDASTQAECDVFDKELSSEEHLALATGSKAHHVRSFSSEDSLFFLNPNRFSALLVHRFFAFNTAIQKLITKQVVSHWYPPFWLPSSSAVSPQWIYPTYVV